ncbi:protein of unknown function [Agreia sp. COWG]|nr:protein of unknown function [Agreia sp. COWG]
MLGSELPSEKIGRVGASQPFVRKRLFTPFLASLSASVIPFIVRRKTAPPETRRKL